MPMHLALLLQRSAVPGGALAGGGSPAAGEGAGPRPGGAAGTSAGARGAGVGGLVPRLWGVGSAPAQVGLTRLDLLRPATGREGPSSVGITGDVPGPCRDARMRPMPGSSPRALPAEADQAAETHRESTRGSGGGWGGYQTLAGIDHGSIPPRRARES